MPVFTGTGSRARRTPTASSGVISEYPYSIEIPSMPDFLSPLLSFLGKDGLTKAMIALVIFFILIVIFPSTWASELSEKSSIPFGGQVFVFALSYLIGCMIVYLGVGLKYLFTLRNSKLEKERTESERAQRVQYITDSLSRDEWHVLHSFAYQREKTLYLMFEEHGVSSLRGKKVLLLVSNQHVRDRYFNHGDRDGL